MNKQDEISDDFINQFVKNYDKKYRLSFDSLIRDHKKSTHLCQYNCYETKQKLVEGEECARNCFQPLLFSKKNISYLIESIKEHFEKCRFNTSQLPTVQLRNNTLRNCMLEYDEKMLAIKNDVEYIYKGYLKNFDELTQKKVDDPSKYMDQTNKL